MKKVTSPRSRQSSPTRSQKRPVALLVDDSQVVLETLKVLLTARAGCRVLTAETSERALSLAKRRSVDVVISDLIRPGMMGMEFLQVFKQAHPGVPVIIYSGVVTAARARRARALGAFRCLTKPSTGNRIVGAVADALASSAAHD